MRNNRHVTYVFNGVEAGTYEMFLDVYGLHIEFYWCMGRVGPANAGSDDAVDNDFAAPIGAPAGDWYTSFAVGPTITVMSGQEIAEIDAGLWWYDPHGYYDDEFGMPGVYEDELPA